MCTDIPILKSKPAYALALDVDGTLTFPEDKSIRERGLFIEISSRLGRNIPVGLITGRSLEFVEREVLKRLRPGIPSSWLQHLFVIGEKGSAWIEHNANGAPITTTSGEFTPPEDLLLSLRNLTVREYDRTMFWDEEKKCMASIEYRGARKGNNISFSDFQKAQKDLVIRIRNILATTPAWNQRFKIDATTIATDVQDKRLGKHHAMNMFLALMGKRHVHPTHIFCFGDSYSDLEMYEMLLELRLDGTFVFVGDDERMEDKRDTQGVVFTDKLLGARFDAGTFEYLKQLQVSEA